MPSSSNHTIQAVFTDDAGAESAVGRLEMSGVPKENISIAIDDGLTPPKHRDGEVVVTAQVDNSHYEKALLILSAEGRVSV